MGITVNYKELIVKDLEELPPELIQEVIDFVEFLKIKKMKKTGVDYESLLLQQESLSRIWKAESGKQNLRSSMSYKRGDIVVVKFPFILKEEAEKQKGRPSLVISNDKVKKRYNDVILAAITSHIPTTIMEAEIILEPEESTG
jgi:hypothetical protein